jgi:hypothetical protein
MLEHEFQNQLHILSICLLRAKDSTINREPAVLKRALASAT